MALFLYTPESKYLIPLKLWEIKFSVLVYFQTQASSTWPVFERENCDSKLLNIIIVWGS